MIQRQTCYIYIFSFSKKIIRYEIIKSLFTIGTVFAIIFSYDSKTIIDFGGFNALLVW